jgi:hypothetical protein
MGKTFKYGYSGHSFRSLERHAEEKINDRRRERRALKNRTEIDILDIDYVNCKKFDPSKNHTNTGRIGGHNSTASWNKINANMEWEDNDNELIGTTENGNSITIVHNLYRSDDTNTSYNVSRGSFIEYKDKIGKKQLKRRDEIGKIGLINRHDDTEAVDNIYFNN